MVQRLFEGWSGSWHQWSRPIESRTHGMDWSRGPLRFEICFEIREIQCLFSGLGKHSCFAHLWWETKNVCRMVGKAVWTFKAAWIRMTGMPGHGSRGSWVCALCAPNRKCKDAVLLPSLLRKKNQLPDLLRSRTFQTNEDFQTYLQYTDICVANCALFKVLTLLWCILSAYDISSTRLISLILSFCQASACSMPTKRPRSQASHQWLRTFAFQSKYYSINHKVPVFEWKSCSPSTMIHIGIHDLKVYSLYISETHVAWIGVSNLIANLS